MVKSITKLHNDLQIAYKSTIALKLQSFLIKAKL